MSRNRTGTEQKCPSLKPLTSVFQCCGNGAALGTREDLSARQLGGL